MNHSDNHPDPIEDMLAALRENDPVYTDAELDDSFTAVLAALEQLTPARAREADDLAVKAELGSDAHAQGLEYLERGDLEHATHWLRIAARQGIPAAQCQLQELHELQRAIRSVDAVIGQPDPSETSVDLDQPALPVQTRTGVSRNADKFFIQERPSVGRALQQARIAAGLTVGEVSNATRVRIAIVRAIEQDDVAPCGGDVYVRGHIRTLARALHLDPEPLLAQFAAEHGGRPAPTPAAPLFKAERIRPERQRPNWTAAMVAAIVAVIGFVGFPLVNGDDGADGTPQVAVVTPTPRSTPAPRDSAVAAVPRDKVTVTVSAIDGRSRVSVKDHNGLLLWDGMLEQGDSKTFQDNEQLHLVLGDAGAIRLYVNGKKIDDEFRPGGVERLTYTKSDPE